MSDRSTTVKGLRGEEIARKHLRKQGLTILETNYRTRQGELDIIARERDTLVFVEVKTALSTNFGNPLEWIPLWKQNRIVRVSQSYLLSRGLHDIPVRYDVVGVDADRNVCHVRDAFRPSSEFFV